VPRLSTVRVEALGELIDQLRFSAPTAAVKHLERAEALALELDPEQNYPLEWVLFRLTDYRSSEAEGLVTGGALLSDLSAIVERLCSYAKLTISDLPEHFLLDELCARWRVSTKTIARWRRQGLVARRVTTPESSKVQLAFTLDMVEHFEQTHAERIKDAGNFSRLSDDELLHILGRIERYQHSLGWNRSQAIDRMAQRTGRSREALRLTVVKDQRHSEPERAKDVALFEAWRSGRSSRKIGEQFSLPASTVQSRVLTERSGILVSLKPRLAPTLSQLASLDDLESLLEPEAARTGLVATSPTRLADLLVQMNKRVVPVGAHEQVLARAMAALRVRVHTNICALGSTSPRVSTLDAIETDLRWASRLKATLAQPMLWVSGAQMREVIGGAGDRMPTNEWLSLIRTVLDAMSSGLDRWDPWSKGRPAGAVSLAVGRAATRWLTEHPQAHRETSAKRIIAPDATINDWTRSLDPWQAWLELPFACSEQLCSDPLIQARYGLAGNAPLTAAQLAVLRTTTASSIERSIRSLLVRTNKAIETTIGQADAHR